MRAKQFITESTNGSKERFVEMFSKFLPLAMQYLKLDSLPKIVFEKKVESTGQPTFGMYVTGENVLYVALVNRHPNDILRTVAHELQHYKQDTEHQLDDESGTTGSAEENEANAMAGIVMRHFNKQYPEYLKDRPVISESWTKKYKSSINCSNPKGFSQRAHCQGRNKNESTGDLPSDPGPKEFVSNKFYVKFTADAVLIYDGGELVYKRPGNYSNPTRRDASVAKSATDLLWRVKHNRYSTNSPYIVLKPADIHKVADEKGIPWNNSRKFLNLSKKLTGKGHLDNMTPEELRVMFDYLTKIKVKEDSIEERKRKRKKVKSAAYGSGPYGWYGFDAGYSGNGGDAGGGIEENFADGRNPQDKGDSKRHGVPTKASVSTLRKVAKQGGRKGQLAHWLANMKAGRAKKK
jgi:hypothetical protein